MLIEDVDFDEFIEVLKDHYGGSFQWKLDANVLCGGIATCLNKLGMNLNTNRIISRAMNRNEKGEDLRLVRKIFNILMHLEILKYDSEKQLYTVVH